MYGLIGIKVFLGEWDQRENRASMPESGRREMEFRVRVQ